MQEEAFIDDFLIFVNNVTNIDQKIGGQVSDTK